MLITDILDRNARLYEKETALVERDPEVDIRREITWETFREQSLRLANGLRSRGIKKGDRVVLLMKNCIEWLPYYFGILYSGAWVVPLNFRFLADTIHYCCEISEAKAIIFGQDFIERIDSIKHYLDQTITCYIYVGQPDQKPIYAIQDTTFINTNSPDEIDIDIQLSDEAGLYFTSGTTGSPKAVLLTHRNLEASCYIENHHHHQIHSDNFLCIPPLYHTGAKMHWFGNFIVGAKAVILKGIKPQWILEAISEEQITIVWLLVPWAYDILLAIEKGSLDLKNYDLSFWRLMHIGAQPVPSTLIHKWKQVFPHHEYDTNYGLTEATGPGCVHLGIGNLHKIGAIGIPGFDWEMRIVDRNMADVPLGEPGELIVKGPGIMKAYYKNEEETLKTIQKGWLCTGDIARIDNDGFVWLLDRKKDIIISGGENIFPVEIEDFLMKHDLIQDAAVIGIPDERIGEIVTAIIQFKPGMNMTEHDVISFCQGLPKYKRPKKIFFDDVPRNPTGKIEKPKLRKKFGGISTYFKR
ncbi:MAG: AMP-binding protein [Desulfobacterales bacterium]|nr:AMP-binding protein [Desulfobacterales bacterium]